jgi:hypothetical protein
MSEAEKTPTVQVMTNLFQAFKTNLLCQDTAAAILVLALTIQTKDFTQPLELEKAQ